MTEQSPPTRGAPLLSIALISAAALAYELLLIRLFSIVQWHHFAQMVISLALLGYAASGTLLTLSRDWQLRHYRLVYSGCLALFGLSAVACSVAAQHLPLNPEALLWDARQLLVLSAVFLLLSIPFLFAANAIGLTLCRFSQQSGRIYAMDLIGAGLGSGLILGLLFLVPVAVALRLLGMIGLAAAALSAWPPGARGKRLSLLYAGCALGLLLLPDRLLNPTMSPYKSLSQALRIQGTEVIETLSSPLAQLSVVASPRIPWRHAPGLSLLSGAQIPEQLAVFTDGGAMSTLTRYRGNREALAWLDQVPAAAGYHLADPESVLLSGVGGGEGLLQAIYHDTALVVGVELNPQLLWLLRDRFREFAAALASLPGIKLETGVARAWLEGRQQRFDLILLDMGGLPPAMSLVSLGESYEFTVEALRRYWSALRPDGYLSISLPLTLPPRIGPRLLATVIEALTTAGVADAGQHMALVRGWQSGTLLVKNGRFEPGDIQVLKRFAAERAFDLAWYPGMSREQANRYNLLAEPWYFDAATGLLGADRDTFVSRYKFNLSPVTDDRPYFLHSFRWRTLPEILALRGQGGVPLMDVGYLVLLAALLQAVAVSGVLVLLPLGLLLRWRSGGDSVGPVTRVLLYFIAIGLGYLFLEIAFIQRITLLLHHPLYAASLVLATFLICSGLGSLWIGRFRGTIKPVHACLGVVLVGLIWTQGSEPLFAALQGLSTAAKVVAAVAAMAPLALLMGMPFPLALGSLGRRSPSLVPWAWGINGASSVVAALLATVVAVDLGFSVVLWVALAFYLLAAATDPAQNVPQASVRP